MLLATPFTAEDGPEYVARTQQPFTLPKVDITELRKAIPNDAFQRSTRSALLRILPVFATSVALFLLAKDIDVFVQRFRLHSQLFGPVLRWSLWFLYWNAQGIVWAGFFAIGHEALHNNLSPSVWINHGIGFVAHSWIMMPYFSYLVTHIRHHKTVGHLETDEVYVPRLRSNYDLPPAHEATKEHYREAFEESQIMLLYRFMIMQFMGLPAYFTFNTLGSKRYPKGSSHWNPYSGLWNKSERRHVHASNAGVGSMVVFLYVLASYTSWAFVSKIYFVPYFISNHWVVTMTFLQHSCPTVPFYRGKRWTRARGALSTIDRPFLGILDEIIFLNVNRYHTVHHLFTKIPFYNLPVAHAAVLPLLGSAYNFDSTGVFRALWRSFSMCLFVEDQGNVVFYKDCSGNAHRVAAPTIDD